MDICQDKTPKNLKKSQIFFTWKVDIGNMAKKKIVSVEKHIRVPKWMDEAIQEIADKRSYTYTDVVLDLLRQELAVMGYTMGIGREAVESGSETGPSDKRDAG
jgi:N-acyl-D-aspartate/D-glutamate deacylase